MERTCLKTMLAYRLHEQTYIITNKGTVTLPCEICLRNNFIRMAVDGVVFLKRSLSEFDRIK